MLMTPHVVPNKNDSGNLYSHRLSIAPTLAQGGASPKVTFQSLAELLERFASVGIHPNDISLVENTLRNGHPISLPGVDLTDDDLRKLGF